MTDQTQYSHRTQGVFSFVTAVRAAARDGGGKLARVDHAAVVALAARRSRGGTAAACVVSAMAERAVAGQVLLVAAAIGGRRAGLRTAVLTVLAVPSGAAARWLLSELIQRKRPPEFYWLVKPTGYSMPSRHTTVAALTAGAGLTAVGVSKVPRRAVALIAAAIVGTSRVYLGVHWPTDVLAGWLFAEVWLGLAESALPSSASGSAEQVVRADGRAAVSP